MHRKCTKRKEKSKKPCFGASLYTNSGSRCINAASMKKKVVIPKSHPPAWGSALWQHVDTIRLMRRSRKKWREIADYLTHEKGVPISAPSVRNFFARATDPKKSRPLGFEPVPLDPPPQSAPAVQQPTERLEAKPLSRQETLQPKKPSIWSKPK